jgi:hypothetical protein
LRAPPSTLSLTGIGGPRHDALQYQIRAAAALHSTRCLLVRPIPEAAQLTVLALVDDTIELNCVTIARLLLSVRTSLSIRDQAVAAFDFAADAAEDVAPLEARIA